MSKYASEYSMVTTKIRSLLYKGVKFCWIEDHQAEINNVIASPSNLDKLKPYHPDNGLFIIVDMGLPWLGSILFHKDSLKLQTRP